jgi:integrase
VPGVRRADGGAVVKFSHAVDVYIADMRSQGRINSPSTERGYRGCLDAHGEDVANRDPRTTNRDDVKTTLRRWTNPNSQSTRRAILVSFYDWCMEEGIRKDNPARQTRRPRRRKPNVYRFTRVEAMNFLQAAVTVRERRACFIGVCAGARNAELRGLQGRHFQRPGWVWISADIGKGGRERWVPVLPDLEPIAEEIRAHVALDEYVLPAQRWRDPGANTRRDDLARHRSSAQALYYLVKRVAARAGVRADVGPHTMRHAFGDHVARYAGMRNAQYLLGHAGIGTTESYVGEPTLDELAAAVHGLSFLTGLPSGTHPSSPHGVVSGAEPVLSSVRAVEPDSDDSEDPPSTPVGVWLERQAPTIRLYIEHFRAAGETR